MNLLRGYSAPQPVQRKVTVRHARFRASGRLQCSQAGFCLAIFFPLRIADSPDCKRALFMPYGRGLQGRVD